MLERRSIEAFRLQGSATGKLRKTTRFRSLEGGEIKQGEGLASLGELPCCGRARTLREPYAYLLKTDSPDRVFKSSFFPISVSIRIVVSVWKRKCGKGMKDKMEQGLSRDPFCHLARHFGIFWDASAGQMAKLERDADESAVMPFKPLHLRGFVETAFR